MNDVTQIFVGDLESSFEWSWRELKFAFLWFDRVVFHTPNIWDGPDRFYHTLLTNDPAARKLADLDAVREGMVPTQALLGREAIDHFDRRLHQRMSREDANFELPPDDLLGVAHNAALRALLSLQHSEGFDLWEPEEAARRVRRSILTIELWQQLADTSPTRLMAKKAEQAALDCLIESVVAPASGHPSNLGQIVIPDLTHVAFHRLTHLKSSRSWIDLKREITSAAIDLSNGEEAFANRLNQALGEILERTRPRPFVAALRGILSSLPVGLVNPFSILEGTYSTVSETRRKKDFGWVYLLHDLQK